MQLICVVPFVSADNGGPVARGKEPFLCFHFHFVSLLSFFFLISQLNLISEENLSLKEMLSLRSSSTFYSIKL